MFTTSGTPGRESIKISAACASLVCKLLPKTKPWEFAILQSCWFEFVQSGILHTPCQQSFVSVPTVFFFYANESGEPHHIHVQRERLLAKFWLKPVSLASSSGFPAQELSKLMGMVETNQQLFVEAWNGFFNS